MELYEKQQSICRISGAGGSTGFPVAEIGRRIARGAESERYCQKSGMEQEHHPWLDSIAVK